MRDRGGSARALRYPSSASPESRLSDGGISSGAKCFKLPRHCKECAVRQTASSGRVVFVLLLTPFHAHSLWLRDSGSAEPSGPVNCSASVEPARPVGGAGPAE